MQSPEIHEISLLRFSYLKNVFIGFSFSFCQLFIRTKTLSTDKVVMAVFFNFSTLDCQISL